MELWFKNRLCKKLKLMEGAVKLFSKKLLGHEIFGSVVSRDTTDLLKNK